MRSVLTLLLREIAMAAMAVPVVVLATAAPGPAQTAAGEMGETWEPAGNYPAARHGGNYMHNYYFPPAPSSTPWAPAWSPDGESLAVALSGSIWRVDPGTGAAEEMTSGPGYHSLPAWSPDGRFLVHTVDRNGQNIALGILDLQSGEGRALLEDEFLYTDPVFAPDGTKLAYVTTAPSGYFNVRIHEFRDGALTGEPIAVTRDNDFGRNRLYFGPHDMHLSPAWLPDSRELLLVSNRDVPLGSGDVVRVAAAPDGFDERRTVLAEQSLYRTRPDVSLDGKRFVYSSTAGAADQFSNLYVQPTTGGSPYKLTFFEHDAFHPRWSPDGEWIAYIDNEDGLPQLALLETYGGKRKIVRITRRTWRRPTGVLSVRTVDEATGEETASRIHLSAGDGRFYAPTDAFARIGGAREHSFHQPGRFRLEVPTGPLAIEAVKGFEYEAAGARVEITAGEVVELTLRLPRITDMAAKGWWSGSTHIHMNYAGNLHNTLENLMFMSAAEDQEVVLEQVANKDNRVLDHQHFVPGGGAHPLSTEDRILVVGQEYRPPFYGHVFYFGLREHLISPFTTGYEGTGIESLYPSNTDLFRKARAQGATVGYVHAFFGEDDPLVGPDGGPGNLGGAKGYMVDAALGTTDAVEWSEASRAGFHPWYATLNNGLRVTAVGGEDSISNMQRSKLVGSVRTYVHTGEEGLALEPWLRGVREGRAFVSCGPLLDFRVEGRLPGGEVALPDPGGEVSWSAWVRSPTPLERVWIVANGEDAGEVALSPDRRSATVSGTLAVEASSWAILRAEGNPEERRPLDCSYAQAFTNPVWITVGGRPVRSASAAEYSLRWLSRLREMAEAWPHWRSTAEEEHVYAQFDEARAIYEGFLAEARALGRP